MDIQFFDDEGEIVKKNFKIPNKIDFNKYHYQNLKTVVDQKLVPGYELFATIAFDAKKVDDMSYYPIIKKEHKQIGKNQWYVF
jgi:hypothetical protein